MFNPADLAKLKELQAKIADMNSHQASGGGERARDRSVWCVGRRPAARCLPLTPPTHTPTQVRENFSAADAQFKAASAAVAATTTQLQSVRQGIAASQQKIAALDGARRSGAALPLPGSPPSSPPLRRAEPAAAALQGGGGTP